MNGIRDTTLAILFLLLAVAAVVAIALFTTGAAPGSVRIAVMTTSDIQSRIFTPDGSPGGLSRISMYAKTIRSREDGTLLVSSGDDLIGPVYGMFHGEPEMKGMTLAGYDAVTPGNHEFDLGPDAYLGALAHAGFPVVSSNLLIRETGNATAIRPEFDLGPVYYVGSVARAGFPVVSSNLVIRETGNATAIRPYLVLDVGGVRTGIFGLMTPDLARLAPAGDRVVVDGDLVNVSRRMVSLLRSDGARLVIAISHAGAEEDRKVAGSVPGIHVIVGGHDHIYLNETVAGPGGWTTRLVQAGSGGEKLGILRFTWQGGGIRQAAWETVAMDSAVPGDPAVENYLGPFRQEYEDRFSRPVGETLVPLEARSAVIRTGESNLGNLVTDSWREWFPDAEIALVHAGAIRGDTLYPAGPISL
ncbi:MAG: bifunctional metallophosphatase/5'-nucleotidase, partial [Methanomicrobiales archaeon]|nr:bifunctional metallophosphatase/5'-nucleotidase [Methanomicrobiales archaeon]